MCTLLSSVEMQPVNHWGFFVLPVCYSEAMELRKEWDLPSLFQKALPKGILLAADGPRDVSRLRRQGCCGYRAASQLLDAYRHEKRP